jgi:ribosome biogenesis SPOUT family RNA methylase Rps3
MSSLVGKDRLLLTNFPFDFEGATCTAESVTAHLRHVPLQRICLLDSEADETLCPADAGEFDYFLFGGILGNGTLWAVLLSLFILFSLHLQSR